MSAFMSGSVINFDRFNDDEEIQKKAEASAAQGGPNSGFEIEGIDFFKDPELANEFPELKDDIELIISSESYVNRLVDFHNRVIQTKGMSRGMAIELNELVPSLEGFSPMHFTEDVSGIGVEPSLEALSAKIWAMVAAAIVFVVGLIYKFIKWMWGGKTENPQSLAEVEKGVKEADKKIDDQFAAIDSTRTEFKKFGSKSIDVPVPNAVQLPKMQHSRLPEALKEKLEAQARRASPVVSGQDTPPVVISVRLKDVLSDVQGGSQIAEYMRNPPRIARVIYSGQNTPALQMTLSAFEAFTSGAAVISGNLDLLKEMMQNLEPGALPEDPVEYSKFASRMQMLDEMLSDGRKFRVGGTDYTSMASWAVEYRNEMNNQTNFAGAFHDLEEFLEAHYRAVQYLKTGRFEKIGAFFHILREAEPVLTKLAKIANTQNLRDIHVGGSAKKMELTGRITRVSSKMSNNLKALMIAYQQIGSVYSEVTKTGAGIVKRIYDNAHHIVRYYETNGFEPPAELVDVADEIESAKKRAEQALIAPNLFDKLDPFAGIPVVSSKPVRVVVDGKEFGAEEAGFLHDALKNLKPE